MRRVSKRTTIEDIPYFHELGSFYKHVNARPPLHEDFDIREIDPEVLKNYDYVAKPFRHSFYCITLFLRGDITLNAGFWKTRLKKPALYFKTPCQIVSWTKPERWLREYFIVFTDNFLLNNKALADIIFELPFFKLEKAIPFEIEPDEVELLGSIYRQVLKEYRSDNKDKFALIASYVYTLLLHVRRLFLKYSQTDEMLVNHIHTHEQMLVESFRALIRKSLVNGNVDRRHLTMKYLAAQLSVHPNYLNAVVKRQKGKTAIASMHEQISHEAQTLLSQTTFTIKEIAFRLGFADAPHFNHFFKKKTGLTPVAYRKKQNL